MELKGLVKSVSDLPSNLFYLTLGEYIDSSNIDVRTYIDVRTISFPKSKSKFRENKCNIYLITDA